MCALCSSVEISVSVLVGRVVLMSTCSYIMIRCTKILCVYFLLSYLLTRLSRQYDVRLRLLVYNLYVDQNGYSSRTYVVA